MSFSVLQTSVQTTFPVFLSYWLALGFLCQDRWSTGEWVHLVQKYEEPGRRWALPADENLIYTQNACSFVLFLFYSKLNSNFMQTCTYPTSLSDFASPTPFCKLSLICGYTSLYPKLQNTKLATGCKITNDCNL